MKFLSLGTWRDSLRTLLSRCTRRQPCRSSYRAHRLEIDLLESRTLLSIGLKVGLGIGAAGDDQALATATDAAGNIYVTGHFNATVDFGSGTTLTSQGAAANLNAFVAKYTSTGTLLWADQVATDGNSVGRSIAVDAAQNVYVIGDFAGQGNFVTTSGSVGSLSADASATDVFVCKFNSAGGLAWSTEFGGSGANAGANVGNDIALDSGGNVFITGGYEQTVAFGSTNLTSTGAGGGLQVFACKMDGSSGSVLWAGSMGGFFGITGAAVATDPLGNVFVAANIFGGGNFDPNGTHNMPGGGFASPVITKLDPNGNFLWAEQFTAGWACNLVDMTVDSDGNLYSTGNMSQVFGNTVNFDPHGTLNLSGDGWIAKLDNAGFLVWAQAFNGVNGTGISLDSAGNVYTTGALASAVTFGTFTVTPPSSGCVYVTQQDPSGTFLWAGRLGDGGKTARGIAVDPSGDMVLAGSFTGDFFTHTTNLSPDLRPFTLTSSGGSNDIFVAKIGTLPAGITLTQTGGSTDVIQGVATDAYTVVLTSQPTGPVTISATPDPRLTVTPASVVFTPATWYIPQTFTVSAVVDENFAGPHVRFVAHTATSSDDAYDARPVSSVAVHISAIGGLVFSSPNNMSVLEGTSRTYTAALTFAPEGNVTVTLAAGAGLTLTNNTLVFTPANWNQPQSVPLSSIDNAIRDGNRTSSITHSFDSADPLFDSAPPALLPVLIVDDENVLVVNGSEGKNEIRVLFSSDIVQVVLNRKAMFYSANNFDEVVVLGGRSDDVIHLVNPILPVAVLGSTGNDKVSIDSLATANNFNVDTFAVLVNGREIALGDVESALVNGKNGADIFTVESSPGFAVTLQGGGGADTLFGPDQDNTWAITGASAGKLNGNVSFTAIENLTGRASDDTFVFSANRAISGQINGGQGDNTLDLSAYKTPITANLQTGAITGAKSFRNITSIRAGTGPDKLIAANTANTWNITGPNTGTVGAVSFAGFENLTGGTLADTFVFAAGATLKGKIDGAAGVDILNFSASSSDLTINLQSKSATSTGGWLNLEQFLGGSGVDKLVGPNKLNTWNLTATGAGTITGGYTFANFENLSGGTMADTFDLTSGGDWLGLLDGTSGLDTLIAAAGGVYTGGSTGTLNGHSFKAIETRR